MKRYNLLQEYKSCSTNFSKVFKCGPLLYQGKQVDLCLKPESFEPGKTPKDISGDKPCSSCMACISWSAHVFECAQSTRMLVALY
ncbi:hypothetical protein FKM82_018197 [Ascaphus truei]